MCDAPATVILKCEHILCELCFPELLEERDTCCGLKIERVEEAKKILVSENLLKKMADKIDRELKLLEKGKMIEKFNQTREQFENIVVKARQDLETQLLIRTEQAKAQDKEIEIRQDDLEILKDRIGRIDPETGTSPENLENIQQLIANDLVLKDFDVQISPPIIKFHDKQHCRFSTLNKGTCFQLGTEINETSEWIVSLKYKILSILDRDYNQVNKLKNVRSFNIVNDTLLASTYKNQRIGFYQLIGSKFIKYREIDKVVDRQDKIIPYPNGYLLIGPSFAFYSYTGHLYWEKDSLGYFYPIDDQVFGVIPVFGEHQYRDLLTSKIVENPKVNPHHPYELSIQHIYFLIERRNDKELLFSKQFKAGRSALSAFITSKGSLVYEDEGYLWLCPF